MKTLAPLRNFQAIAFFLSDGRSLLNGCQYPKAIQAKLNVYQAKEHFESFLKNYNNQVDNLINLVALMKNRIIELEGGIEREKSIKNVKAQQEEVNVR